MIFCLFVSAKFLQTSHVFVRFWTEFSNFVVCTPPFGWKEREGKRNRERERERERELKHRIKERGLTEREGDGERVRREREGEVLRRVGKKERQRKTERYLGVKKRGSLCPRVKVDGGGGGVQ